MQIENEFTVPAPPDELWAYLLDIEKIVPCMPGAELTETVDATTWKGRVNIKFGPMAMTFAGQVQLTESDALTRKMVLAVKAIEQKGHGAASATIAVRIEHGGELGGSLVIMTSDITITGRAAQFSRGMIPEVSKKLTSQFAECLKLSFTTRYADEEQPSQVASPFLEEATRAPSSVGGFGLALSAIRSLIVNFLHRPIGRKGQN
jgi:carbon monoxide dehydrogenase subunit G